MTELEKAQLEDIVVKLIGTLGSMNADEADKQVADQVKAIYAVLGYEVKSFVLKDKAHIALRVC